MFDVLAQIAALALLASGVAIGYRRWIRPRRAALSVPALGLLILLSLTLTGGFIGGLFWWLDATQSFAWDLPALAARILACAGWTFAVLCFLVLEHPTERRVRLALLLLNVYLVPLVMVVPLFHLSRFDFARPITYGFFIIAGGMMVVGLWYLFRQPAVLAEAGRDTARSGAAVRSWLGLVAVIMAVWGLALFITDDGPSSWIWVWPGDLLTSRLIAVMLWAIAAGAVFALPRADTARLMLGVTLTYGVGVAAANAWSALAGQPIQFSYLIAFGGLGLISAVWLVTQR